MDRLVFLKVELGHLLQTVLLINRPIAQKEVLAIPLLMVMEISQIVRQIL